MNIQKEIREIKGSFEFKDGTYVLDENSILIEELLKRHLIKVKSDLYGWESLFIDPQDLRFWILSYPNSDLHGGGAPFLKNLDYFELMKDKNWIIEPEK